MQTSALICLLACSVVAFCSAVALPMTHIRFDGKPRHSLIGIIAAAFVLALLSAVKLATSRHQANLHDFLGAMWIVVALVGGTFTMWTIDVVLGRLVRHEEEILLIALLAAAVVANLLPSLFCARLQVSTIALWCVDGVLCQAVGTWFIFARLDATFRCYDGDDPPDLGVNGCHRDLWEKFPRPARK